MERHYLLFNGKDMAVDNDSIATLFGCGDVTHILRLPVVFPHDTPTSRETQVIFNFILYKKEPSADGSFPYAYRSLRDLR